MTVCLAPFPFPSFLKKWRKGGRREQEQDTKTNRRVDEESRGEYVNGMKDGTLDMEGNGRIDMKEDFAKVSIKNVR